MFKIKFQIRTRIFKDCLVLVNEKLKNLYIVKKNDYHESYFANGTRLVCCRSKYKNVANWFSPNIYFKSSYWYDNENKVTHKIIRYKFEGKENFRMDFCNNKIESYCKNDFLNNSIHINYHMNSFYNGLFCVFSRPINDIHNKIMTYREKNIYGEYEMIITYWLREKLEKSITFNKYGEIKKFSTYELNVLNELKKCSGKKISKIKVLLTYVSNKIKNKIKNTIKNTKDSSSLFCKEIKFGEFNKVEVEYAIKKFDFYDITPEHLVQIIKVDNYNYKLFGGLLGKEGKVVKHIV